MSNEITYLAVVRIYDRETDDYIERAEHEEDTRHKAYEWLDEVKGEYAKSDSYTCKGNVYAVVECCGEQIVCSDFTNTCDICGADYNSNGIRLAPRSQWGEETGEHWTDCY